MSVAVAGATGMVGRAVTQRKAPRPTIVSRDAGFRRCAVGEQTRAARLSASRREL